MYVLNFDDVHTRCVLVRGCKELETVVRFITREGIWLSSLYWIDNLGWYQVCFEFGGHIDIRNIQGKRIQEFVDICQTDGGKVLNIVPWSEHTRR